MSISEKFTPEAMLGAPRRSPAVPNYDGTLALHTVSSYDFVEGKETKELKVTNIQMGDSHVLSSDDKIEEALWVPGTSEVVCLVKGDEGMTRLVVTGAAQSVEDGRLIAEFDGELTGMKLKRLDGDTLAFAAVGLVGDDGKLFNEKKKEKKKSTARIFDTPRVWVWDRMVKENRYVIWYSQLSRAADGAWSLGSELHNLLHGTELEVCGVYDVDEPQDHYDIGTKGILFDASCSKPDDEFTRWACSNVYFTEIPSFVEASAQELKVVTLGGEQPVARYQNVQISPDGETIVFLLIPYSDDADTRVYLGQLSSLESFDVFKQLGGSGPQLPPSAVTFAGSSDSLILTTDDCGRATLQSLKVPSSGHLQGPVTIFRNGTVDAFYPLTEGDWDKLLVSSTSFVDNSLWQIVDTKQTAEPRVVSSSTSHGALFGLTPSMMSEMWYEGVDEARVHTFIVKPSNFDPEKKYPWVLMPHGGPVGSWHDSWSTRWNSALWAEQGYVLVMPNIAGSTGFGLDFISRVYGSWGGAPYGDLVNLMRHLEELPYLDMDRAAVAGGSYGGYLISWIFGNDLATKFRCAIWHDGITSLPLLSLAADDLDSPPQFDGLPLPWLPSTSNQLAKWDPASPERLAKWHRAPPTLIIHGQRDHRCPVLHGLGAYRALKAHGVEARFLTFEDEGHWVLGHENARVWNREVFSFLKKHIGGGQE